MRDRVSKHENAVHLSFFHLIFVAQIRTVNALTTRTNLVLLPSFAAEELRKIAGEEHGFGT